MLKSARSYEEACRTFRWRIPGLYNLAFDVCDRQTMAGADGHRTALAVEAADGTVERATFHMLRLLSNRLANVLAAHGVIAGERVLISLPPSIEAAIAILAVLKMGAVAVPAPCTLGEIPLAWRLADSGAHAAIVAASVAPRLLAGRDGAPNLTAILVASDPVAGTEDLWQALEAAPDAFPPQVTGADAPAFLFYPADAMGRPPGILHAHRTLPGSLPPVEFALGFFPQVGDIFWTPADWMSFEALIWGILPAWHHGMTVIALTETDPTRQLAAIGRHGVRAAWIPPAHLRRLTNATNSNPSPNLRALASGPEPLDEALRQKAAERFGVAPNDIFGTVLTGATIANGHPVMERLAGSPGRAAPGITVEAVDASGRPLPAGERGLLAASPGSPGACLGRWTGEGWVGTALPSGWQPDGMIGSRDLDGYVWPDEVKPDDGVAMIDDLPVALEEVEAALIWHPGIAAAAIVQLPSGELKAFVVPGPGHGPDIDLARRLQAFIATRRAIHEVPRRIEFVDSLPTNADGIDRDALLNRPLKVDAPDPGERWG
ncbi:AMP-binding protein [Magnetospirillum moscoviense]|uniref:Acyl-CoA synthetase n=1 Tax=Magnetospirillum moscoviense TaxID=1437059 RepID=A0A178MRR7_9PROT|nr:AMP-binding protein [Magnetospirillum moscoviense]MBF0324006.1 AMP-binding protein [Alphaproteobacteria bacterium]OAN50775.1 acyl-CoA synthetase [Magnetospirillum moscoviense]